MIVGLCGHSKAGKNALAERMEEYEQAAFADALKVEVTKMLRGLGIEADLWGADKEEWRDLLVFWGRKRREQDRDYWIKQLYLRIAPVADKRIVITDVRYANEVAWVHKQGGWVMGLDRPGFGPANGEEEYSIKSIRILHPEVPWLKNDGTLDQLEKAFRATLKVEIFKNKKLDGKPGE